MSEGSELIALNLPPDDPPDDVMADIFAKPTVKLGLIPNMLTAYSFDNHAFRVFVDFTTS